jgi:hypothetical protein
LNDNGIQIRTACLLWRDYLDDLISRHLSSLLMFSKMERGLVF